MSRAGISNFYGPVAHDKRHPEGQPLIPGAFQAQANFLVEKNLFTTSCNQIFLILNELNKCVYPSLIITHIYSQIGS